MDLSTSYLGLTLENPVIAGASTVTGTLEGVQRCAEHGPGAIVLRSLFEEQILEKVTAKLEDDDMYFWFPQASDFVKEISKDRGADEYLRLVEKSRATVPMPIIASVNCMSDNAWPVFAARIESAGASALELNIAPSIHDEGASDAETLESFKEIIHSVRKNVRIPIALKVGPCFTNPRSSLKILSDAGVRGFVLFNRFYRPDIDINRLELSSTNYLSTPEEVTLPVRWIAMVSREARYDIAGSTGVHDYTGVVKMILAGARAVQVASALYKHGPAHLRSLIEGLRGWMVEHGFGDIERFRGLIARDRQALASFERIQFLKVSAGV